MRKTFLHNISNIVTVITVAMFFSCNNNYNEVKKIGISENEPIGEAEQIDLKYTDSGRVTANLISPKMIDFTNRSFAFREFPNGVHLNLFDKQNKKSTIIADYAIVYEKTGLIDLQGNVVLASHEKDTLFAEQLYFDEANEWLFTNKPVTFKSKGDLAKGNVFDTDKDFSQVSLIEMNNSVMTVKE
ncbi:LPS export ABC transporter periplasmic protein LptC [Corallibacter vietnamensis]|uniref:LPS export ABC transporter periplasmic protein LptC n=1 Tax=Corallibacter vietnamensis TaxID=904130 RepID=A0ABP7GUC3_9FLAO